MIPITVTALIYRSSAWLDFVCRGLQEVRYRSVKPLVRIIANDPIQDIAAHPMVDEVFRNPDPDEYYLRRVYRAWNYAVESAPTELVCLLNSDMYVSDDWLDELYGVLEKADHRAVVTSLLVESGYLPSALPEYVRNFGQTPGTFQLDEWRSHAVKLASSGRGQSEPGKLFMPVLLSKTAWREAGGYPIGNVSGGGSGDKVFFEYLEAAGYPHRMAMGSVVSHLQEGEMTRE